MFGLQQFQPVFYQRGIGAIVIGLGSTQPELRPLSSEQVRAVLRRERREHLGGHRDCLLGILGQKRQQCFGKACEVPGGDVGLVAECVACRGGRWS